MTDELRAEIARIFDIDIDVITPPERKPDDQ
jgi:hypothetical protein